MNAHKTSLKENSAPRGEADTRHHPLPRSSSAHVPARAPDPPATASSAYGFARNKALVLANVILLGRLVKVTRVFDDRPLVVPTLYKIVLFGVFAFTFEAIKYLAGGIHGKHVAEVFR